MLATDKTSGETDKSSGSIFDTISTAVGMSSSKGEGDAKTVKTDSGVETALTSKSSETSSIETTTSNEGATSNESSSEGSTVTKESVPKVEVVEKSVVNNTTTQEKQVKKKKTKRILFKEKKINGLLKKIKTTKKTEEELLSEMEAIVNVQIEKEIQKNAASIKRLTKEKEYLIKKIKKEFTKKLNKPLFRFKNSPPSSKTKKRTKKPKFPEQNEISLGQI